MAPRTSNLADVVAQFLSTIVGRACYFSMQIFLARKLGPLGFGLYAIGWTVTGLIGTLTPVGMAQAVLRYGVAGRRALLTAPFFIVTLAGLVGCLAVAATAGPVAGSIFGEADAAPVIVAFAPSVLLMGIFGVLTAALRASHANLTSSLMNAVLLVLYLGATLLAFAANTTGTAVLAGHAYTLAIVLTLIPTVWLLARMPAAADLPTLPRLMQFGLVTMFINSANLMNLWADRVVIGVMTDAESVGIYQVASQLATIAIILRGAVYTVFEARVPKAFQPDGRPPDVTREFLAAGRILLHVSAPGLICLALTATFWTGTLFGPDYTGAALPLALLIVGQLILTFNGPAVNALHMTGGEHFVMRLTTGTCVLNVVGNIALIPVLGLAGSAVAFGLANFAVSGACLWRLRRTGRLRLYFSAIGDIALASVVTAAVTAVAVRVTGAHSVPAMIGVVIAAYAAYGIVVAWNCRVEDEAFDFARSALRRAFGLPPGRRLPAP